VVYYAEGGGKGGEAAGADRFKGAGAGAGSSSSYGGPTAGQVYMGPKQPVRAEGHGYIQPKGSSYLTRTQAYNFINALSGKQLADLQAKMFYGGLIQENDGLLEMQAKWKKLVDASYGLTQAGNKVSPMDVLDAYLGRGPLGGKGGLGSLASTGSVWQTQYRQGRKFLVNSQTGEVKYQGPRFETTYDKSIDLTDPTTAKALATSVFQQLLHRDPGAGELGGFGDALRSAEQQAPVVTNTTVEYDPNTGEPIGQSSTRSGGLSGDAKAYLAEQRVKKTKEYASTQAATTYLGALEDAVFNNPYGSV
jgi:hypothetical protein